MPVAVNSINNETTAPGKSLCLGEAKMAATTSTECRKQFKYDFHKLFALFQKDCLEN